MLSRVANLTYWMARYLERAENASRILDANTQLVLDAQLQASDLSRAWEPIVFVSGDDKVFRKLYTAFDEASVVDFTLFNQQNPNSVLACVNAARENARCIRDQISSEVWEQINRLYLDLQGRSVADYHRIGSGQFLSDIRQSILTFYGVSASMLPRNEAWQFYELGRFLERADNTSRLLDVKYFTLLPSVKLVGTTLDAIQWSAVLRSCSAFEAFRKNRRGQINAERVIDYLILDEHFPRSIRYAIIQAEEAVRAITRDRDHHFSNPPSRSLGRLRADFDYTVIKDIIDFGLHEWIDKLQSTINSIHGDIEKTFFFYDTATAKIVG
jgi:uncharacterized alpha-E superfamily protein